MNAARDPGLCGRNVEVGDLPEPHKRQPVGQTRPAHQGARMLTEMLGSFLDGLKLVKNFGGHGCHHLYRGDIHLSRILKPVSGTKLATWCRLSSGNAPSNNAGNCRKKTFQWRPWPSPDFSESFPGIILRTFYCGTKGSAFARVPTCCDLPRRPPEHGSPLRTYDLQYTDPPPF